MWGKWAGFELGVELRAEEKWVDFAREFGDFHEYAVGRFAGKDEAAGLEFFYVLGIHLKAVAVTLMNQR